MTPEQERQLAAVHEFMLKMENSTTIPLNVGEAFRVRLAGELGLSVSAKGANSEDQAVDEGGVATYTVIGDPVGFLQVTIAGTDYNLPYY